MNYRDFGKTEEKVSLLGFGTMRLPLLEGNGTAINEAEAIKIIRYGIDHGINYVDTAYMYHGGNSEVVVGKALKDGYREKVLLADKMPVWMASSEEAMEEIFNKQLERLQTNSIDMYLIHSVEQRIWKRALKFHIFDFLEKKKKEGKIKYIGFSFHDSVELFKEVLDYYPWDFCQIQLNFMDTEYQAGLEGLNYAASKEIPVVIMEPLKGGRLANKPPESVQQIWDSYPVKRSPAEWALKWVANHTAVKTILSGMSSMEQVKENLDILGGVSSESLTTEELELINKVKHEFLNLIKVDCTKCNYCTPCPLNIDIPEIFKYYNDLYLYKLPEVTKKDFNMFIPAKYKPSVCSECGQCEEKCPQHIKIREHMKNAATELEY